MQTSNAMKILEEGDYDYLNSSDRHRIDTHDRNSSKASRKPCIRNSYSKTKPYPIVVRV